MRTLVAIAEHTVYEPDVLVNCGAPVGADSLLAPAPVIVVEVITPTSRSLDTNGKLADYFRLESVNHYLVVDRAAGSSFIIPGGTARSP